MVMEQDRLRVEAGAEEGAACRAQELADIVYVRNAGTRFRTFKENPAIKRVALSAARR
ncbi:MAG: hypothetical protein KAJ90_01690 [Desulfobacterales bacterium]|nr:hypothetical protein [Desulfobacterales bacterium]